MDMGPFRVRLGVVVYAAGVELDIFGAQIRPAFGTVAEGAAGAMRQHPIMPWVVGVIDGHIAAVKEDGLGIAVSLHGMVEIQMGRTEVGKDTPGKADAVYPDQHQCMRGDFHHHMGASRVCHAP